jgi:predicted transcriptional regulator
MRLIDAMMRCHHDAVMRTTVDLPADLHRIVSSLAVHTRRSLSSTAVDLIRRGLAASTSGEVESRAVVSRSTQTGLPTVRLPRTVTPEDVKVLEDEA